ncbi:hypothetical protein KKA47_02935 [bacterium]|nr:hypothetical protein [bacterium]
MSFVDSIQRKIFGQPVPKFDHKGQHRFIRSQNEAWSFDGRILLNGYDVRTLIDGEQKDTSFWRSLMTGLDVYRKEMWSSKIHDYVLLDSVVNDLMERLMYKIGNRYEEKINGLGCKMEGKAFYINNINVKAVLAMYRVRPTKKAQVFLRGVSSKLYLIMNGKSVTSQKYHLYRAVKELYEEVVSAINNVQTISSHPLLPGRGDFAL